MIPMTSCALDLVSGRISNAASIAIEEVVADLRDCPLVVLVACEFRRNGDYLVDWVDAARLRK